MIHPFLDLIARRAVILDGATATSLLRHHPTVSARGGDPLVTLSDALAYTRPEWVRDVHRGCLAVGCDAVETNTFNGSRLVLSEFGLADRCYELSRLNARLAREVADEFSTPDR